MKHILTALIAALALGGCSTLQDWSENVRLPNLGFRDGEQRKAQASERIYGNYPASSFTAAAEPVYGAATVQPGPYASTMPGGAAPAPGVAVPSAPEPAQPESGVARAGSGDLITVAEKNGRFSRFLQAVETAGLTDALRGVGPYTVFVPSDAAFAKLPPTAVEALRRPENRDTLRALLAYHVVPGRLTAADLRGRSTIQRTAAGLDLVIDARTQTVTINGAANLAQTDIPASNGIIHVVDSVLRPPATGPNPGATPPTTPPTTPPQ